MPRRPALAALLLAIGAAGDSCDPYDPSLGNRPFRCGDAEPRCPDHYTCVDHGDEELCETSDSVVDAASGDADPACGTDTDLEPNDTLEDPTDLPIPSGGDTYTLADLAVCPSGDTDLFRFSIDATGKSARIQVTYDSTAGSLDASLLNSTGVSIRAATPTTDPDILRADFTNLAAGTYFARVTASRRASYDLDVITTTGTLPP